MSTRKINLGIIFGGRSVEHDVSIVTAQQIMRACDANRYEVVPIYISRDGRWYTGDVLRDIVTFKDEQILQHKDIESVVLSPDVRHHGIIRNPLAGRWARSHVQRLDVVFPAIHGSHGEDGTLQGLFELADIPYVGFATLGSALTNDKILSKHIFKQHGIPVVDGVWVTRADWERDADSFLDEVEAHLGYPVFVKPATLGSSIGVGPADERAMLKTRLDVAMNFDRRVLVERAVKGVEINCAVMGYGDDVRVSVLEQPVSWDTYLSYEDKYLRGDEGMKSADRLIPAPLDATLTEKIQDVARQAFRVVDGRGIVRIDFLLEADEGVFYVNELNTMPGSLAFYLWQASDMTQGQVVDTLVHYAREAHAEKRRNLYDYKTNLVDMVAGRGLKGVKGRKT